MSSASTESQEAHGKEPSAGPDEITQGVGNVASFALTPLQQIATWFAGISGAALLLVTFVVLVEMVATAPHVPALVTSTGQTAGDAQVQAEITAAQYRMISDAQIDREQRVLDSVVVKLLVPIFTLSIGYVFGARVGG